MVEMRHIDCKPWEKIAQAVHMSRSRVFDYYNAALDTLLTYKRTEKLLGDYTAEKEKKESEDKRSDAIGLLDVV